MGRRKTNLKKKIAARKQKGAMECYKNRALKQCIKDFMSILENETKKQKAYRWN